MHFQTSMEANENLKTLYWCINCEEPIGFTKRLYCNNCGTAVQRKEMALANEQIRQENIAKGYF